MTKSLHFVLTYAAALEAGVPAKEAQELASAALHVDKYNATSRKWWQYLSDSQEVRTKSRAFHMLPFTNSRHAVTGPMSTSVRSLEAYALSMPDGEDCATDHRPCVARLGIAMHTLADSWAHQDFVAGSDPYNDKDAQSGIGAPTLHLLTCLNRGHGSVGATPDTLVVEWSYENLNGTQAFDVSNADRFYGAFEQMTNVLERACVNGLIADCVPPSQTYGESVRDLVAEPRFSARDWKDKGLLPAGRHPMKVPKTLEADFELQAQAQIDWAEGAVGPTYTEQRPCLCVPTSPAPSVPGGLYLFDQYTPDSYPLSRGTPTCCVAGP